MGGFWEGLQMPAGEAAIECCGPCLMGDSGQNSQDQNAERNTVGKPQAQDGSVGSKEHTGSIV